MSMTDWAKNEVELAIAKERELNAKDEKPVSEEEFEYGVECYRSALKGYLAVADDNHSGYSWSVTREILHRLMMGQPLTPIEDVDESWNDISKEMGTDNKPYTMYQSKRMSSLFKSVYDDGRVLYHDNDRAYGFDINTSDTYRGGLVNPIINEMFPITFPYMPPTGAIKVYTEQFLVDPENGDFDTVGILYLGLPNSTKPVEVMRFFREPMKVDPPKAPETQKYPGWVEITQSEYVKRKAIWKTRVGGNEIVDKDGKVVSMNRAARRAAGKGGKKDAT